MVSAAPTIDVRLVRLARRLSRKNVPAAAVHRDVGRYAEQIGLVRPSYEQIRLVVRRCRLERAARRATAQLLFEVQMGARPVTDLEQLLEQ